jgi:hypothetical protein
MDFGKRVIAP